MADEDDSGRGGKRARTRARLSEAAEQVFAERGFHAATLDAIAARAGMTKGAVYGNFSDKEDLLLSTYRRGGVGVRPAFRLGAGLAEQMRLLGEAVVAFAPMAQQRNVRVADFQLYAATHPAFRERAAERTERLLDDLTALWRPFFAEAELPLPMRDFVILIDAMIDGLLFQRALTPSLITDGLIVSAFTALAGSRSMPRPRG
jgi:AcrR family transcriptional regulator